MRSVIPAALRDAERTAEKSQQADDGAFSRKFDSQDEDLGSPHHRGPRRTGSAAFGGLSLNPERSFGYDTSHPARS